ncbi:MAG: class I tRNA ligase family protein, partial [Candidatus Hermodarchaeota archaeon]
QAINLEQLSFVEKAFLGKVTELQKRVMNAIENDDLRKYTVEVFFNFNNEMNRFERLIGDSPQKPAIMNHIFNVWVKLASPVIPHAAEELWHRKGYESFISLESYEPIQKDLAFEEELTKMTFVDTLIDDIRNIIKTGKIEKIQTIQLTVSPNWKYTILEEALKDKKDLIKRIMAEPEIKKHDKQAVTYAKNLMKKGLILKTTGNQEQEIELLKVMENYIGREFKAEIVIDTAEESASPKAKFAVPGKPGIQIVMA